MSTSVTPAWPTTLEIVRRGARLRRDGHSYTHPALLSRVGCPVWVRPTAGRLLVLRPQSGTVICDAQPVGWGGA
jgi:hypothetical protein